MSAFARRFRFGYALAPKKVHSFVQPSLVVFARERGIDLIQIDTQKPLVEQGPFDCVLHKMSGDEWAKQLHQFSSYYPDALIIDPLPAIERLHNRVSMLQVVMDIQITPRNEILGVPTQVFVRESLSSSDPTLLHGLNFPMIAKPLIANGTAESHEMSLVFNADGLRCLKPPFVLQEFVNHGGVIFKVYVAGEYIQCVKRKSLPDVSEDKLGTSGSGGFLSFSQISNHTDKDPIADDGVARLIEAAVTPPLSFVTEIANELRHALGLHLFNFDMIRDTGDQNRYYIIDINYFPGYAKMPSYETILTDFFLDIIRQKHGKSSTQQNQRCDSDIQEIIGSDGL